MAKIIAIAAVDDNYGIGLAGRLPWHLPTDLKRFKSLTIGQTVIMGRNTYLSLPDSARPLPGRLNIIISRSGFDPADASVVSFTSVEQLLDKVAAHKVPAPNDQLWIIGGQELYRSTSNLWNAVYLTRVPGDFNCDTFFPHDEITGGKFSLASEEQFTDHKLEVWNRIDG